MLEDFEAAMAADAQKHRRYCGFGRWLRTLSADDAATASRLVHDTDRSCRQLARYFQSKGASVNDQVLNRHRNKKCCGQ